MELIKTSKPRVRQNSRRIVTMYLPAQPQFMSSDYNNWLEEHGWALNFEVEAHDKRCAEELAVALYEARQNENSELAKTIKQQLLAIRAKPYDDMTDIEKWDYFATQLPEDLGAGKWKGEMAAILSNYYFGRVLEAMCGFNTYFSPDAGREVVALDYSRESLERYPFPKRKRVQLDLNRKSERAYLPQLGMFDTVSICFGYRYLRYPAATFTAFRNIIRPAGQLVLLENPNLGYVDIVKRGLSLKRCVRHLEQGGFRTISIEEPAIPFRFECLGPG